MVNIFQPITTFEINSMRLPSLDCFHDVAVTAIGAPPVVVVFVQVLFVRSETAVGGLVFTVDAAAPLAIVVGDELAERGVSGAALVMSVAEAAVTATAASIPTELATDNEEFIEAVANDLIGLTASADDGLPRETWNSTREIISATC